VEILIPEQSLQLILEGCAVFSVNVVHIDEQVHPFRQGNERGPVVDVVSQVAPEAGRGACYVVPPPTNEQEVEQPIVSPALSRQLQDVLEEDIAEYLGWEVEDRASRLLPKFSVRDVLFCDKTNWTARKSVKRGSKILSWKSYSPSSSLIVRHRVQG
jgi:hypothetical protein